MISDSIPVSRGIMTPVHIENSLITSHNKRIRERENYSPHIGVFKEDKIERMRRAKEYERIIKDGGRIFE